MLWMKYGSRFFILLVHKFFKKFQFSSFTAICKKSDSEAVGKREVKKPQVSGGF